MGEPVPMSDMTDDMLPQYTSADGKITYVQDNSPFNHSSIPQGQSLSDIPFSDMGDDIKGHYRQDFQYNVGRAPESDTELQNYIARPGTFAQAPQFKVLQDRRDWLDKTLDIGKSAEGAAEGAARTGANFALGVPAGLGAAGRLAIGGVNAGLEFAATPNDTAGAQARASADLQQARQRSREISDNVHKLMDYVPASAQGKAAEGIYNQAMAAPFHAANEGVRAVAGDAVADTTGEVGQDIGNVLQAAPALKAGPVVRGAIDTAKAAGRALTRSTAIPEGTQFTQEGVAVPASSTRPMAGTSPRAPRAPLSGDDLRAAPNPLPKPGEAPPAAGVPQTPAQDALRAFERRTEGAGIQVGTPAAFEQKRLLAAANAEWERQGSVGTRPDMRGESDWSAWEQAKNPQGASKSLSSAGTAGTVTAPERTFAPPSEEGPQPTPTPEAQDWRSEQLGNLNQLAGGTLENVRGSAVTGDYAETGADFHLAKLNDEAGKTMQAQIASEHETLHNAADAVHDSIGSVARNSVDTNTLEQRAGVVRPAFQAIKDWFKSATDGIYDAARRLSGPHAIPQLSRVQALLDDDTEFSTTDGIALQKAAKGRLQRLWTTGDPAKNAPPGSVAAAERFREFLNEQLSPTNGRLVGKLKDAVDEDVAEHGGPGLFKAARDMRTHQSQMLESNPLIEKMLDRDNPTADRALMDKITNAPREQFTHLVNVLRSSAHLGDGELAKGSAAAIREIKAHMASRMHDAAKNSDGTWNARDFYTQANQYATKAPAVFSPAEMGDLQTLNNGGNILRMDKGYSGAYAQQHQLTHGVIASAREKAGIAARGIIDLGATHMAGHLGPMAAEMSGVPGKVQRAIGGPSLEEKEAAARLESVKNRIRPLERGSVSVLRNNASGESAASLEAQSRVSEENARGRFRYQIDPDGNVTRLRGVDAVDARAPMGHIIVQRGIGAQPYSVLDRGGLPGPAANGLLARATGLGKLRDAERGSVRVMNQNPGSEEEYSHLLGIPQHTQEGPPARGVALNAPQAPREPASENPGSGPLFRRQAGSVRVMRGQNDDKPLGGAPAGDQPNPVARKAAAAYMKSTGRPYEPLSEYRYVQPEVAKQVADAYDAMKHDPSDPKVKAAYDAFKVETLGQYKQMVKAGVKVDLDKNYPYKAPREVQADVRDNNHMSIFPTETGFGTEGAAPADHPMLERAPVKMGGQPATYNDLFRAVHDYYGHVAEGNGFRANGEYNAWRAHRTMYSDAARPAMDSETLGQNSWVNSGPRAAANTGASQTETTYAEQKAGLLPPKVVKAAEGGVSAQERHVTNLLTDQERAQLRSNTSQKLIDMFHKELPHSDEYAAAALAGKAKKGWYRDSAQAIVNQFGPDANRFTALLSSMSPQQSVQANFHNALRTFVNWDKAGRPTDPAAIRSIMEDSSQRSPLNRGNSNVLQAWVPNAVRALTDTDPEKTMLSGPKVNSFMQNLRDNVHEVTNDAWMATFAKVDPAKLGGSLNKSGPGKSPMYMAMSAKVREAARTLSKLTGETWTPREVQETVWSWAKTAFEHAEELGDRTIPDLVKHGAITDDLIRSTPDFNQLFSSPEHRGFLQNSRFAGAAEQLAGGKEQSTHTAGTSEKSAAAESALRPSLEAAARRLESVRQGRKVTPEDEEVPF